MFDLDNSGLKLKVFETVTGLFLMPYARNPHFIGRDTYIKDLGARLESEKRHNRVALVGLGGIG
jgi:hypothetical protein